MLLEFYNKTQQKHQGTFVVFMAKDSFLSAKSETGHQIFILSICHWDMNPDQDSLQTSMKMPKKNWLNTILSKVFENIQLS